jgi:hypothetical protein
MLLRPFLNDTTSCASYLFGCGTQAKLAVVDPHAELADGYLATAAGLGAPIVAVFETHLPHRALGLTPQLQSGSYALSARTRRITSTDATASAESSTNTHQQRDGWICAPHTLSLGTLERVKRTPKRFTVSYPLLGGEPGQRGHCRVLAETRHAYGVCPRLARAAAVASFASLALGRRLAAVAHVVVVEQRVRQVVELAGCSTMT